jgi:hypothetical protein
MRERPAHHSDAGLPFNTTALEWWSEPSGGLPVPSATTYRSCAERLPDVTETQAGQAWIMYGDPTPSGESGPGPGRSYKPQKI